MKIGFIAMVVILFAGTAYAAKDYVVPTTWRYKITIEIETPEGIKSGSAVREVRAWKNAAKLVNPDLREVTYRTFGEAVQIDLGESGVIFYPIDWDSNSLLEGAFPSSEKNSWSRVEYYKSLPKGLKKVQEGWMSFIWLKDLTGAEPMRRLDSKDFVNVFGDGFRLKQTVTEITDDPVTWKLDDFLNRLAGKFGKYSRESFQFREKNSKDH